MSKTEKNKQIVRRYLLDVWGEYDFEAEQELVAEDVVHHNVPPQLPPGLKGHHQLLLMSQTALPEIEVTIEELLADGDKVTYGWTARGTHWGDMMGVPPTQRQIEVDGITINRGVVDGKIV